MESTRSKLPFDITGYYFIGLFVLVILGFWPSYFAKFFNGTANFSFYFHFHAAMLTLWIVALIAQPILIRKRKLALHKLIGRFSYLLFPMVCISSILIIHQSHTIHEENPDNVLAAQFKNLIVMAMGYFIAIRYRHNIDIHARGMIATGIAIIEPALARLIFTLFHVFKVFENRGLFGNILTMIIIYLLLIGIIIAERHKKRGRWVFPFILGVYFILNTIVIFKIHIGLWESFSKWFISLPLT